MTSLENDKYGFEIWNPDGFGLLFHISTWKDFHQNTQCCYRTGKCTVCRRACALFGPGILQAGTVTGLRGLFAIHTTHTYLWAQTCIAFSGMALNEGSLRFCCCCWPLLYGAVLRSRADSLLSYVILREWLSFYSAFLNVHRSGVLTALAWLVPRETAAVSARLCAPYNHAPCHVTSCKTTYVGCMRD